MKTKAIKTTVDTDSLDIIILLLACTFLIFPALQFPGMQYLSQKLGPLTSLSSDSLQGAVTGLVSLLILAFFLVSRTLQTKWTQAAKIAIVCSLAFLTTVMPTISDITARRDMGLR